MTKATFQVGKTYSTRSACDYNCQFEMTVVSRRGSLVTFRFLGNEKTARVKMDAGAETITAGRYSMAPTWRA